MANRIAGITAEINGSTTGLSKALESVNKTIKNKQAQLKDVERLLKLDPVNGDLTDSFFAAGGGDSGSTRETGERMRRICCAVVQNRKYAKSM